MPVGSAGAPVGPGSLGQRFLRRLSRHPIVCLALLTPGLPEYLSSSSPLSALVTNPAWFFLGAAINVGQYTAGALLVREALLRWRKGWPTTALLALAYGVAEEGLGDNTLFNSTHGADGVLGHFGRFAGVNWVWSAGVLVFHAVFSIGLPLLLLGLALPQTRGRSLLGRRGVAFCFASVGVAAAVEMLLVLGEDHFWLGVPLLLGSLGAVAGLVLGARVLPSSWGRPPRPAPSGTPRSFAVAGFALFPALFLVEYGLAGVAGAAPLALALDAAIVAVYVLALRARVGERGNRHLIVAFATGAIVFEAVFGLLVTLPVPFTLPLAVLAVVFCLRLRRRYPAPAAPGLPPGRLPIDPPRG